MNIGFVLAIIFVFIQTSQQFFFSEGTKSSCSYDRQCGRYARCVDRIDGSCGLGNVFRSSKRNCAFKECSQCLTDGDCFGDSYCSQYRCQTRYRPQRYGGRFNRRYGY